MAKSQKPRSKSSVSRPKGSSEYLLSSIYEHEEDDIRALDIKTIKTIFGIVRAIEEAIDIREAKEKYDGNARRSATTTK
jgi:hypothetical protein